MKYIPEENIRKICEEVTAPTAYTSLYPIMIKN